MRGHTFEPIICSIAIAVILLLLLPAGARTESARAAKEWLIFERSGVSINAERADSPDKRARGLMNRRSLGAGEGMIFVFDEPAYHSFWMYNTLIPLTILFLDEDFRVVDIQDMSPCRSKESSACPVYVARKPAKYAIEVNQGFATKHGIIAGDRVTTARDKKERIGK